MDDIFGRVVSMFIAVCIMFGMPFIYMTERAKSARQMLILSEVTHFVDSVSNIGFIDGEMLRGFYGEMSLSDCIENISILHESDEYVLDDNTDSVTAGGTGDYSASAGSVAGTPQYVRVKTYHDESDIWNRIEKGESYRFLKGDYLKVTVREQNAFSLFPFLEDNTVTVVYGGCIKYEAD